MLSKEYIINSFADQNATIYLQKQLRTISPKEIDNIINILVLRGKESLYLHIHI